MSSHIGPYWSLGPHGPLEPRLADRKGDGSWEGIDWALSSVTQVLKR